MSDWICLKCYKVTGSLKAPHCCRCDQAMVEFDIEKYQNHMISGSNSWRQVWEKWSMSESYRDFMETYDDGNQSAPRHLNAWIEHLVEKEKEF